MLGIILAAAAGYVAGAFTPSIGRKIKALFVKEAKQVEAAGISGVAADIKAKL